MIILSMNALVIGGMISLGSIQGADRCSCYSTDTHELSCEVTPIEPEGVPNRHWLVSLIDPEYGDYVEGPVSIGCYDDSLPNDASKVPFAPKYRWIKDGEIERL